MITLEIAGISVDLTESTSPEYPRNQIEVATVVHTASGAVASRGTRYEPKHIWTLNLLMSNADVDLLSLIYREHETRRRRDEDANILVYDGSERMFERVPRTRPAIPSTIETPFPATGTPTYVAYFAVFNAWFVQEPQFTASRMDSARKVSFTLQETDKLLAS